MDTIQYFSQYILHIDTTLFHFIAYYGSWTYLLLFAVIFCETGLVITPFLPGDSLLFAAGSIASASSNALDIQLLAILLLLASILGNKVNYLLGRALGPRIFNSTQSRLLNKKHLAKAHRFYAKHGGKTIIMARFIPIIRTFVPFVAGASNMSLREFSFYNIISAVLWIGSLLGAGYFFGSIPLIKNNFTHVIYMIVLLSILPPLLTSIYRKLAYKSC